MAAKHQLAGFICGNLLKREGGGVSGGLLAEYADRLISRTYRASQGRFTIIGCGGIFSATDAYRQIKLGASLVQLITGLIYQGPQLVGEINHGLVKLLAQDGLKDIKLAIGVANQ